MKGKKVIVIGAGLGGLATALRLAHRGYQVEILEKDSQPGGRLNVLRQDGFTFDVGPSFFSMSYEFQELFRDIGMEFPLRLRELDPLYTVYFAHKDRPYQMYKNLQRLEQEFADVEPGLAAKIEKYLEGAGAIFHDTEGLIVKRNYKSKLEYLMALTKVPMKHSPKLFRTMWTELSRHFTSEEVKIIFSLVSFFLGARPFLTPAVYSLLNYTELVHDGYWSVEGGMYRIVEVLVQELERRGVPIHLNTEITDFVAPNGHVSSFIDRKGKVWTADIWVSNSDAAAFRGKVLRRKEWNEERLDKMEWSLAPFTMYVGVKGKIDNLHHHNYFLGSNFKEYADRIFTSQVMPDKPYYYVNVPSKSDPNCAPEGCENLFILAPVPDRRFKADWADSEAVADNILADLSARIGFDVKASTVTRTIYSPMEWESRFNLYKGSGLGLAHGLWQVGAFRPKNVDEHFSNLYYVGASTTPGTGLPIVVISSKLVTERIQERHGHAIVS